MTDSRRQHPERKTTRGGRALEVYIRKYCGTIPAFAEANGLDRIQIQRAINGERWKRITVDFAYAIEQATDGAVKMQWWLSDTADGRREAA